MNNNTISLTNEEVKLLLRYNNNFDYIIECYGGPDYSEMLCPCCGASYPEDDLPDIYVLRNKGADFVESAVIEKLSKLHAPDCEIDALRALKKKLDKFIS